MDSPIKKPNEADLIKSYSEFISQFHGPHFYSGFNRLKINKEPIESWKATDNKLYIDNEEMSTACGCFLTAVEKVGPKVKNDMNDIAKLVWKRGPTLKIHYLFFLKFLELNDLPKPAFTPDFNDFPHPFCSKSWTELNFGQTLLQPIESKEEEPFLAPKRVCRAKSPSISESISTENAFEMLTDDETTANTDKGDLAPGNNIDDGNVAPEIQTKPTKPIMVFNIDMPMELTKQLRQKIDAKYKCKLVGRNLKIIPETQPDKLLIMTELGRLSQDFYTLKDELSPLKIILKGIPPSITPDEVKNELIKSSFEITSVIQFKSHKDKKPLPVFLITLPKNPKSKELFNTTSLFDIQIRPEPYKPRKRIIQCYNCQNFQHYASQCYAKPRCVRCGESHSHRECTLEKSDISKATCANCGLGHPSSYKGCSSFPKLKTRRNLTYAQAAKNAEPAAPPLTPQACNSDDALELNSLNGIITELKKELKINSFAELRYKLKSTLINMKKLTSMDEKVFCFLDLFKN